MTHTIKVLDHGFVTLRNLAGPTRRTHTDEVWGVRMNGSYEYHEREFDADDRDPAQAARMSFEQMDSDRTLADDMKLARYLLKNKHTSPFEQVQVWLEMKLPIFVARQFVRHRTVRLNEVSGRYVQLPAEWYIPELKNVLIQSDDKKQGGKPIDLDDALQVSRGIRYLENLQRNCVQSYGAYQDSIQDGIAMEQSRLHLHLNHYTHWIWNQDLHNLLHFLGLRDHSHAQAEAQAYARAIKDLLKQHLPETIALWESLR